MEIKYTPFKEGTPIIFLDTNAVIEMTNGLLSKDENHRGMKLFNSLSKAVRSDKVICPFLYQRNEYFTFHDKKKNKACDDVLLALSKGKQVTIVQEKIFQAQFQRMAQLFLKDEQVFSFKESDIFNAEQNNESELEKTLGLKIVAITSGFKYPNQDNVEENLLKIYKKRKDQVKADKLTKEQLFKEERRGRLYDLIKDDEQRVKYYKEIDPKSGTLEEISLRQTKTNVARYWLEVLKTNSLAVSDMSKLFLFIKSEYFLYIPVDHISSILHTELLLTDKPIKTTDMKDINSISIIFPYATLALIDGEMQGYVYRTNLNSIFDVKVFSLKSYDKFILAVESL